ncbi:disabled homolog 2-like, partial [Odontesthes bonariensis]|uniref:disabled homolog 2-like n=1 Tax=Odontesthes bonariensis TaxID=219752 RepID=UPI003F589A84
KYSTGSSFKSPCLLSPCDSLFILLTDLCLSAELIHKSFVSHCPSHVNQDSNEILLLDFSAEVDSNQNCIKGNSFITSFGPDCKASPHAENHFSSTFGYFPAPDSDPFKDDPLSKSPTSFVPDDAHISPTNNNYLNSTAGSTSNTIFNNSLNRDAEHLSQQLNRLSSKSMISALNNGQWPLGGNITQGTTSSMMDGNECGQALEIKNPFFDSSLKTPPVSNGIIHRPEPPAAHSKDSVVISPPPQNSKSGRGRRSAKVKLYSQKKV